MLYASAERVNIWIEIKLHCCQALLSMRSSHVAYVNIERVKKKVKSSSYVLHFQFTRALVRKSAIAFTNWKSIEVSSFSKNRFANILFVPYSVLLSKSYTFWFDWVTSARLMSDASNAFVHWNGAFIVDFVIRRQWNNDSRRSDIFPKLYSFPILGNEMIHIYLYIFVYTKNVQPNEHYCGHEC